MGSHSHFLSASFVPSRKQGTPSAYGFLKSVYRLERKFINGLIIVAFVGCEMMRKRAYTDGCVWGT